jgi:atypical dual specificity phosphatase
VIDERSIAAALNFSWLEQGRVAGCRGPRTDADLASLAAVGVRALVRLAAEDETGLGASEVERHAIRDCYEPVSDWTAPLQEQLERVITFIEAAIRDGEPVAVSCGAGYGRTGTVLGCYLVSTGLPAQAAIERLVTVRPCSREILRVPGQKDAVFEFYRRKKNLDSDEGAV